MNAFTWSTTIAALMFSVAGVAAEKPSPGAATILIDTDAVATKPALIKLSQTSQDKPGEGGTGEFEIEIVAKKVDKDGDQAKKANLPGKPGESTDRPRHLFLFTEETPQDDRYWIGLGARPLTNEERNNLNVQGEWGLIIEEIVPEGPAASAGLKPHDVLWKAGKTGLKRVADLVDAVRNAKNQDLAIEFQRDGGKRQTIVVKPAKRPVGELEDRPFELEVRADKFPPDLWRKLAAGLAVGQSVETLQASRAEGDGHAIAAIQTNDQIKALLAQRRELQEKIKELNEKHTAVSETGDKALAERIQAQLRIAAEQMEAINHQTVALELSRGAPDRDALHRQVSTLRHCASELVEVGRTEEAAHLMSKAHDLEEQLEASAQARPESRVERNVITAYPAAIRIWDVKQPEGEQVRLSQIKSAMQLLAQAGLREDAEHLAQEAESLEREQKMRQQRLESLRTPEQQTAQAIAELHAQIEQMHRELHELKEAVSRISEQKKSCHVPEVPVF